MYLFYLIIKNECTHYYDQFKFDLDTTIKMSVIGLNTTIEEHLLINYFNLLYCWSIDNKDIHYIARLIDQFRYNGYYNFYFVLLCKNSIYNLIHGKNYSDYQYEQIKQLYCSLNGKYNAYFYHVLYGFNALLNDDVTTAYQYIEPLTNLKFFDVSLLKDLLQYLSNNHVEEKKMQRLIHYYDDSTNTCSSKIKEIIQTLKTTYA